MRKHGVKFTQQDFLDSAYEKWGCIYDYSKVEYTGANNKVCIICPEHGEFFKSPAKHVNTGQGCPTCAKLTQYSNKTAKILTRKFKGLVQPEDHKLIPLTQGVTTQVSNEDFDVLSKINWKFQKGYATNTRLGCLHRVIMNPPNDMFVDHIDRNPLNNKRTNLRIVTKQENTFNSAPYGKSKYKGVCWIEKCKKWQVQIIFNGQTVYAKHFTDEIEGAKAYNKEIVKYHKEFAYLNTFD